MSPVVYRLDAADCIVAVNAQWEPFARANDAPELTAANVLEQPLWEFVRERSLVLLYRQALAQVRTTRQTFSFPYRCDSPTLQRQMQMTLTALPDGGVEFCSELRHSAPLPAPLIVRAAFAGRHTVPCCSLCRQLYINGAWTDVGQALTSGQVLAQERPLLVVYRVCDDCRRLLSSRRVAS